MHELLQHLADAAPDAREKAAQIYVTRRGSRLPTEVQESIAQQALAVLGDARLAALFGPGSRAEVSLAGSIEVNGRAREIVGQIDRLAETDTQVLIADRETGEALPLGEVGEICARSPGNMTCYWGNPEATAATIRADGFLRTGDLGVMDEHGYVRFAGRLREVIIRGGENIYPAEVEDALLSHPAIALAAVVKVPHERLGHEVGAVVTLAPGAEADIAAFEAHVAEAVARFKVPCHWRVLDQMPLTVSGKIRKVELEKLFEAEP